MNGTPLRVLAGVERFADQGTVNGATIYIHDVAQVRDGYATAAECGAQRRASGACW